MSTKTSIILVAVILVAAGIAYVAFKPGAATPPASETNVAQQGDTTQPTVQAQDITVGSGVEAKPGMTVSVLYAGKLPDGSIFDSSAAHNNEPLVFVLGANGLIPGFQIGVNGMKEGGERIIQIPAGLGYGATDIKDDAGKVIIPANSQLIFDIKLVKVQETASTTEKAPATPAAKKSN